MLLLFDIDGTLTRGGPAKIAFKLGLERIFGTAGPIQDHDFSGKTDIQITRELLTSAGKSGAEIDGGLPRFMEAYLSELRVRIRSEPVNVLPGVRDLLPSLADTDGVHLGLVTGNLERGAQLKLGSVGLAEYFPIGGFGSDHEARNELGFVALRRAATHWGRPFAAEDAVVIGDTPRDVACGQAVGATTVAVATGRFSEAQLEAAGADRVLSDLSDTEAVISELTALAAP